MIQQARLFVCALQFLTRLPTPTLKTFEPEWISRAAPYYPVVGWIVGGLTAAVFYGAHFLWSSLVGAVLAVAAGFLITGGFHEDGLADTVDGLGGGQTPGRRLEIMKDSRIGSFGALALWAVLTLKVFALSMLGPVQGAISLIVAHGAARAASVVVMAALPYAGDLTQAKLKPSPTGVRGGEAIAAVVLGLGPLALLPLRQSAMGLLLTLASAGALAVAARRHIGGWTGDVLGAVEQLAEAALMLGFAAGG
jgi:adenosylcobinamide-GDP ribazoletransferase